MILRKKHVRHISSFLRPVSRFSAIFPYRDAYKNGKNSHVG